MNVTSLIAYFSLVLAFDRNREDLSIGSLVTIGHFQQIFQNVIASLNFLSIKLRIHFNLHIVTYSFQLREVQAILKFLPSHIWVFRSDQSL